MKNIGRNMQRNIIGRQAYRMKLAYQKKGVFVTERVLREKIIDQEAEKFAEEYENMRESRKESGFAERKKIFEQQVEGGGNYTSAN